MTNSRNTVAAWNKVGKALTDLVNNHSEQLSGDKLDNILSFRAGVLSEVASLEYPSKVKTDLLLKLADLLEGKGDFVGQAPKKGHFDIQVWSAPAEVFYDEESIPHGCETVTCAAGYAGLHPFFRKKGFKTDPTGGSVVYKKLSGIPAIVAFFGLTEQHAESIFTSEGYRETSSYDPKTFDDTDYVRMDEGDITHRTVAASIRGFVKKLLSGKVGWRDNYAYVKKIRDPLKSPASTAKRPKAA